jgi:hypothetical protein
MQISRTLLLHLNPLHAEGQFCCHTNQHTVLAIRNLTWLNFCRILLNFFLIFSQISAEFLNFSEVFWNAFKPENQNFQRNSDQLAKFLKFSEMLSIQKIRISKENRVSQPNFWSFLKCFQPRKSEFPKKIEPENQKNENGNGMKWKEKQKFVLGYKWPVLYWIYSYVSSACYPGQNTPNNHSHESVVLGIFHQTKQVLPNRQDLLGLVKDSRTIHLAI